MEADKRLKLEDIQEEINRLIKIIECGQITMSSMGVFYKHPIELQVGDEEFKTLKKSKLWQLIET